MKLSSKIIIAVLAVAGSTSAVYAVSRHGDGWHMTPDEKVEFVTERVTKKLELDSQQQQNFTALAESMAQIMLDARASREQHIDEISALLEEPESRTPRLRLAARDAGTRWRCVPRDGEADRARGVQRVGTTGLEPVTPSL